MSSFPKEPVDPGPSSHELQDLHYVGALGDTGATDQSTSAASTSPPGPGLRADKPRVRFNSGAAQTTPPKESGSKDQNEHNPATTVRKPRPALTRNPNSSGSVTSGLDDEPMSPEKAKSAAEAARRAQEVAIDAYHQSSTTINASPGSSRRWSSGSEAFTDPDYDNGPFTGNYARLQGSDEAQEEESKHGWDIEAARILRAHTQVPNRSATGAAGNGLAYNSDANILDDYSTTTGNPQGSVFYHILQAYRNPTYDPLQEYGKKADTPETPGTPTTLNTARRKKWYEQENKDAQSQETLARLIGASAKLANPAEKKGTPLPDAAAMRQRKHKRKSSGRFMSMVGLAKEQEAKITIHVAGILQRQKYLIKMCKALMLFGAPTHRLEEYLTMAAKVLEIDSQFLYIPGCMVISFGDILTHTTEVKIVRTAQGVNLGKLKDIHQIYKEVLHDVVDLEEALSRLDTIMNAKDAFPVWLCVLMYGLASAAVSVFFKARFIDMPIIFVLGSFLGLLQLVVAPLSRTYSTVFEITAAILITFLSRALASTRGGNLFCFSALTQSGIAMILPGWMVLSSALELQSKAIVPGSIRMVFAIIYSLFLGYGITVGTALYGAMDSNATSATECANPLNPYWNFLFVPLYVFFTTFTVQAKWKQMPVMIAIATAGYAVNFWSSKRFSASAPIAYTFGAFTIGVLANLYSRLRHGVAAAVLLPAVYVQVPGSLASSGAILSGLQTASLLTDTSQAAAQTDTTQLNGIVFNVAASMIQIAIGITVGLFMSALFVYPLGKRRSGLWTL